MKQERFFNIGKEMYAAFDAGEFDKAVKLADEYLRLAASKKTNWNYGNAIHHAHLILGRISLKKGLMEQAKKHLILAGKTPGSPQLNSFGPNMALAKALLENGEKNAVLEYLNLCKIFWGKLFSTIKIWKWKQAIRKGQIPDFRANLFYK